MLGTIQNQVCPSWPYFTSGTLFFCFFQKPGQIIVRRIEINIISPVKRIFYLFIYLLIRPKYSGGSSDTFSFEEMCFHINPGQHFVLANYIRIIYKLHVYKQKKFVREGICKTRCTKTQIKV